MIPDTDSLQGGGTTASKECRDSLLFLLSPRLIELDHSLSLCLGKLIRIISYGGGGGG